MDNPDDILFCISNLTKRYGDTIALDDVSLNLKKGKITSIYGPNGAGKSTLVKILCGVEASYNGYVLYDNKEINFEEYSDALKSGISYVPQGKH